MLRPPLFFSALFLVALLAVGVSSGDTPGADVGDSCQSNNDCDSDAGQHCVNNKCSIPKNSNNQAGNQPSQGQQSSQSQGRQSGQGQPPSCPGLQPGYTLKCQLTNGQVVNACGWPGAVPGPIGQPCHIGMQVGTAVE
jgi:hypothetical protein